MSEPVIEPYGSSTLLTDGNRTMTNTFAEGGSLSMPLGHSAGYPNTGVSFYLGDGTSQKGHALTFGRTRGGKGVSSIIPALLTYSGSMVVIDPKGENAWITAERRRKLGQRVVILDPWGEVNRRFGDKIGVTERVTRFNPLSALDPNGRDFHDDVMAIAEAFILQTGSDPHWSESARELTGGLIAAEVQRNPDAPSMKNVRALLRSSLQGLDNAVVEALQNFPGSVAAAKLEPMIELDDDGKILNGKELSSIRSTARTQTAFLDSLALIESMETDEEPFDLADLATDKVTLYLVLPVDKLRTHGRWLRLILTLAIRAIARQETIPNPPVVFLLDELGTISPGSGLAMIEQSFGLMAGLGIRIWAFLQDLPQLQRDYPKSWETFISNSAVIQLLNVADNTTAQYFSTYLGNSTINAKTGEWSHKETRYSETGPSFHDLLIDEAAKILMSNKAVVTMSLEAAKDHIRSMLAGNPKILSSIEAVNVARTQLQREGITDTSWRRWVPDTQLMSRPVRYPWEIVGAEENTCILILPGAFNYQLSRYVYYTHPQLSKWARQDPNRPKPQVVSAPTPPPVPSPVQYQPPVQQPPVAPPVERPQAPPPPPAPPPTSSAPDLADLGKAAGKLLGNLADRLKK